MATYYWVGGSGTWDNSTKTNWATSSGGAGGNGPPTNADTANFDANSGTSATVTVASTAVSLSTTVNKSDINLSLSGSPTLCTSAGTLTLTTGTITLNNNTLTVGIFSSNNSNTRAVAFGTGQITLTGSGTTIWSMATATNFSYTGTSKVVANYSGATGTRIFNHGGTAGGTEANSPSIYITAGTDILALTNSASYKTVDFTGFSGSLNNGTRTVYGDLVFSTGMTITAGTSATTFGATSGTQKVTSNGKTVDFPLTVNSVGATVQLQDALTSGSTRTFTLTAGTLDLNGKTLTSGIFQSANTNTRTLAFGTGNVTLTGNAATIWNVGTVTNLTVTGTPVVNCTYSGATGTRTLSAGDTTPRISFNISAGSDTFVAGPTLGTFQSLDFTGFTGTLTNTTRNLYGSLTLASGMTLSSGSNITSFLATSGTQTVTSNGKTMDFPLTISAPGATVTFADALTQGSTQAFTFTGGTIQLKNGVTSTVGSFVTTGTTAKTLQSTSAGSKATLSQASGTVNVTYVTFKDIAATGGAIWNALTQCFNNLNNSGIYFSYQQGKALPALAF